ncbi:MAG: RdgB/HAM1 family non-canonical purine NTP pyrophosphatase [Actinomycetaceae bacterium]|nr:RdgB/HAM1 family non-canonical purine NTP pyrophosphatase [Actinomycetaceae bacterium]
MGVPSGAHLIVATHNEHKLGEIRSILLPQLKTFTGNDRCVECNEEAIISAKGLNVAEPVEDGITFTDNAFIKARALCHATGLPAVADDSGLAVDILGGAPGIFSARWCGHHGDDQANLQLLLDQLHDVHDPHRGASFICAAVVVCPDGTEKSVLAQMSGRLINEPRGSNGFGYDPIFIADGQTRTNAELSAKEKHALSHRGKAFRILAPFVAAALGYQVTTIIADKK